MLCRSCRFFSSCGTHCRAFWSPRRAFRILGIRPRQNSHRQAGSNRPPLDARSHTRGKSHRQQNSSHIGPTWTVPLSFVLVHLSGHNRRNHSTNITPREGAQGQDSQGCSSGNVWDLSVFAEVSARLIRITVQAACRDEPGRLTVKLILDLCLLRSYDL